MTSIKRFFVRFRAFLGKPNIIRQEKPVLVSDYEPCQDVILLIGVHRSGTSLVRRIFNSHHNIACPPETFCFPHYCKIHNDPMAMSGFEGLGYSQEDARNHIARQAAELHDAYRLTNGKGRWADKTPQYVDHMNELFALFGERTRFVLIFRDPRDIAYSIYERGWMFTEPGEDRLIDTAIYVRDRITMMLEFAAAHAAETVPLHYEKLIDDPRQELTRVLAFLGEDFDEAMLRFNESQHNFGTEDPMVRGTSTFRRSTGHWKTLSANEQDKLATVLGGVITKLGYAP